MFDLSLAELVLVVVVIVVFIQPKDVPAVVRAIARAYQTFRNFMHEVKLAFDDIAKESGIADVKETLDAEMRMIRGDDGNMYESYNIVSSRDDVTLAKQRGNAAFGSASETDSKANHFVKKPDETQQ